MLALVQNQEDINRYLLKGIQESKRESTRMTGNKKVTPKRIFQYPKVGILTSWPNKGSWRKTIKDKTNQRSQELGMRFIGLKDRYFFDHTREPIIRTSNRGAKVENSGDR